MKVTSIVHCVVIISSSWLLISCSTQQQKDERIARQYCSSCHAFAEPSLLPKKVWESSVLPQMAFRMGYDYSMLQSISKEDRLEVTASLPGKSMVTNEEWIAIRRYYEAHAPDSLVIPRSRIADTLNSFTVEPHTFTNTPLHTFVTADSTNNRIFAGSRLSKLFQLDNELQVQDSFLLPSPPAKVMAVGKDELILLCMGIMDPNDQLRGQLISMRLSDRKITTLVDSLKRPVFFERADLNGDQLPDIVVCAFGNYTGSLLAFRNLGNGAYERIPLLNLPGARKVITRDFDHNGMSDILALMSQGDEKIVLFLNEGNFDFRVNTLLRFPSVYGSSYFDLVDFNHDGKPDILYTNGDNADYSMILKPYHGVRIFLNNGSNEFRESWFYNMHGASQAIANDFDKDGDLDIAAISFFPDFSDHPEQGFIYFENTGDGFLPKKTSLGGAGRWLTMEKYDIDADGDTDILLR